jgi:hypothetical protein
MMVTLNLIQQDKQSKRKREDSFANSSSPRIFQDVPSFKGNKFFFTEGELSSAFKDRYTDRDEEFVDYCKNQPRGPPPIIDNWK